VVALPRPSSTVLGYYILVVSVRERFQGSFGSPVRHTLPFTFGGLLIASVLYSRPFAVQHFPADLKPVDRRLIEASWTLALRGWEHLFA